MFIGYVAVTDHKNTTLDEIHAVYTSMPYFSYSFSFTWDLTKKIIYNSMFYCVNICKTMTL